MKKVNYEPFEEALAEGVDKYILKNDAKYDSVNLDEVKYSKKHEKKMKKFFDELKKKVK